MVSPWFQQLLGAAQQALPGSNQVPPNFLMGGAQSMPQATVPQPTANPNLYNQDASNPITPSRPPIADVIQRMMLDNLAQQRSSMPSKFMNRYNSGVETGKSLYASIVAPFLGSHGYLNPTGALISADELNKQVNQSAEMRNKNAAQSNSNLKTLTDLMNSLDPESLRYTLELQKIAAMDARNNANAAQRERLAGFTQDLERNKFILEGNHKQNEDAVARAILGLNQAKNEDAKKLAEEHLAIARGHLDVSRKQLEINDRTSNQMVAFKNKALDKLSNYQDAGEYIRLMQALSASSTGELGAYASVLNAQREYSQVDPTTGQPKVLIPTTDAEGKTVMAPADVGAMGQQAAKIAAPIAQARQQMQNMLEDKRLKKSAMPSKTAPRNDILLYQQAFARHLNSGMGVEQARAAARKDIGG